MTPNESEHGTPPDPGRPPSFVYVGGERCASTWIHACLDEHPNVFVSDPKELDYFSRHIDRGLGWYLSRFTPSPTETVWGELSPSYLSCVDAPAKLAELSPGCKLLMSFRNPVDRAYSYYQLRKEMPELAGRSIEEIVERDLGGIVTNGLYAEHLERWKAHFPSDQIHVVFYEDLLKDDQELIQGVYGALGVDPGFRPSWVGRSKNAAVFPKTQATLRKLGLGFVLRGARKTPLTDLARRYVRSKRMKSRGHRSGFSPELRAFLIERYREPNARLSAMLGRDLSAWNQ